METPKTHFKIGTRKSQVSFLKCFNDLSHLRVRGSNLKLFIFFIHMLFLNIYHALFTQLALVQTFEVRDKLVDAFPGVTFEIVEMSTKGDEVLDRALYKIGDKSLFTKVGINSKLCIIYA